MVDDKTMIWAGVGILVLAAAGGVAYWAVNKHEKPATLLQKAAKAMMPARRPAQASGAVGIDYDATASMWEDEDKIYRAAAKLDGGYYA